MPATMPTAEECLIAVGQWQAQAPGTELSEAAARAMANLLRRIAAALSEG